MSEDFSFFAEGYKFHPAFKQGRWDGKIKLIHSGTQTCGVGLLPDLIRFCRSRSYSFVIDDELKPRNDSTIDVDKFVSSLDLPFDPYDYQLRAINDCLKYHRLVVQSPTGSGKSLIIYSLIRWLQAHDKKILLIVPNISLLSQMSSDFDEYSVDNGWRAEDNVHLVKAGIEKSSVKPITISTWQSLQKEDRSYFDQYDAIMVDEAHQAKSVSISKILNNCNAAYRFAFSGTIDGGKYVNRLTIQSLFGKIINTTTTRELIDDGKLTETSIKCILLKHKVKMKKSTYQDEIKYLLEHEKRNEMIVKLALSSSKKGNTLVLFNVIEHGKLL
ncbi:MAG TPA: DEAD/DEAH box helicase, partial [Candidatus Poseidoniales archaeon]|nr:DEAD/DEAH box helicase [Candidatus Poseidoniales archaeon]